MPEPSYWSRIFKFFKIKLKEFYTESLGRTNTKEPLSNWEQKVLEREIKTKEAKKAWDEKRMKSESQAFQDIQENENLEKRGEVSIPKEINEIEKQSD